MSTPGGQRQARQSATGTQPADNGVIPRAKFAIEAAYDLPNTARIATFGIVPGGDGQSSKVRLVYRLQSEENVPSAVFVRHGSTGSLYEIIFNNMYALTVLGTEVVLKRITAQAATMPVDGYLWRPTIAGRSPRGMIVSLMHNQTKSHLYCVLQSGEVKVSPDPPAIGYLRFRLKRVGPGAVVGGVPPRQRRASQGAIRQLISAAELSELHESKRGIAKLVDRDLSASGYETRKGNSGYVSVGQMPTVNAVPTVDNLDFFNGIPAVQRLMDFIELVKDDVYTQMYGSCVANAVALALRFALAHPRFNADPSFKPSRKWIYYMTRRYQKQTGCEKERNVLLQTPDFKQIVYSPWFNDASVPLMSRTPPPDQAANFSAGVVREAVQAKSRYDACTNILQDTGSSPSKAFVVATAFGVCPDSVWPDGGAVGDKPPPGATESALQFKQRYGQRLGLELLENVGHVVTSIQQGVPVILAAPVTDSSNTFPFAPVNGVCPDYPPPGFKRVSGHCVLIVGYDLPGKRLLIVNSWGTGWGISGHAWIPFSWIVRRDVSTTVMRLRLLR